MDAVTKPGRPRSRRTLVAAAIAAVLVIVGGVLLGVGLSSQHHAPQPTAAQASPTITTGAPGTTKAPSGSNNTPPQASQEPRSTAEPPTQIVQTPKLVLPRSVPVSISIPSIGVSSPLLQLGLNPNHSLQVPPVDEHPSRAGWYTNSPTPGEIGPSVILGHIDSAKYGPSVFFKLGALQPGATVSVARLDGTVAVFRVDKVVSYKKSQFPTEVVYGNLPYPGLRLITCGGTFDPSVRSYESNIVAYATLVSSHRADVSG